MKVDKPRFWEGGAVFCDDCPLLEVGLCVLGTSQPCPTESTYAEACAMAEKGEE
jgi:hypothetical protein